jgi:hypothetical protein
MDVDALIHHLGGRFGGRCRRAQQASTQRLPLNVHFA